MDFFNNCHQSSAEEIRYDSTRIYKYLKKQSKLIMNKNKVYNNLLQNKNNNLIRKHKQTLSEKKDLFPARCKTHRRR